MWKLPPAWYSSNLCPPYMLDLRSVFPLRGPGKPLGRKSPKNGEKLQKFPPRSDLRKWGKLPRFFCNFSPLSGVGPERGILQFFPIFRGFPPRWLSGSSKSKNNSQCLILWFFFEGAPAWYLWKFQHKQKIIWPPSPSSLQTFARTLTPPPPAWMPAPFSQRPNLNNNKTKKHPKRPASIVGSAKTDPVRFKWETDFLPPLVLTRRRRSTGKNQYFCNNFPRKYQRIPRNYYQYWC